MIKMFVSLERHKYLAVLFLCLMIFPGVVYASYGLCPENFYCNRKTCNPCGHCMSRRCGDFSGFCVYFTNYPYLCTDGYQGNYCREPCKTGFYGPNCGEKCGHCNETTCHHIRGTCRNCQPGYVAEFKCNRECPSGFYGHNCGGTCGRCELEAPCNKRDGSCVKCEAGFILPLCQEHCPKGTYGDGCTKTCGQCKEGTTCHYRDGNCQACAPGFLPPLCLSECEDGQYGVNCYQKCGACLNQAPCDKRTGRCPGKCEGTVLPPMCKRGCVDGRYGEKCDKECGACATPPCDVTTGTCPCPPEEDYTLNVTIKVNCERCLPGSVAPLCKRAPRPTPTETPWVAIGLGLTGALIFLGSLTAVLVWKTRHRRKPEAVPNFRFSLAMPEVHPPFRRTRSASLPVAQPFLPAGPYPPDTGPPDTGPARRSSGPWRFGQLRFPGRPLPGGRRVSEPVALSSVRAQPRPEESHVVYVEQEEPSSAYSGAESSGYETSVYTSEASRV